MARPTASNFPAALDSALSLFAVPGDRQTALLAASMSVSDLIATLNIEAPNIETAPCFLLFQGGEIWFVDVGEATVTGGQTIINLSAITQRGMFGTSLQPHETNEEVYITVTAEVYNQLKRATEALQQYGFLIGTTAQRTAYTPVAGEGWLDTTTNAVYYCFTGGSFTKVSLSAHSEMTGLADDDHAQYHNDSRANTWHGTLSGVHITSGDSHNHLSAGEGDAVLVVKAGIYASIGSPANIGDLYFATDTAEGGTLYISLNGSVWTAVSGVPSGAIAPFTGACPSGWTRFTALDGKYMKVDNTSPGAASGGATHTHFLGGNAAHYHPVASQASASSTDPGTHVHLVTTENDTPEVGYSELRDLNLTTGTITTSSAGAHTHSLTIPAGTTAPAGGSAGENIDTAAAEPPYKEAVWCKRD